MRCTGSINVNNRYAGDRDPLNLTDPLTEFSFSVFPYSICSAALPIYLPDVKALHLWLQLLMHSEDSR